MLEVYRAHALFVACCLGFGCAAPVTDPVAEGAPSAGTAGPQSDFGQDTAFDATLDDLERAGPLGWLEHLEQVGGGVVVVDDSGGWRGARGLTHWVGPADLPMLLERLDDPTPAAGFVSARSSMIPMGEDVGSTVGREAGFLILSAQEGSFPPRLTSFQYFDFDPAALRAWAEGELPR